MNTGHRIASWLATLLFGEPDDLNRGADCPPYMKRWRIWASPDDTEPKDPFRIYLHRFDGSDWALHPHNHPKKFWSIGLWGEYMEHVFAEPHNPRGGMETKVWRAPWFRSFPADHTHRVIMKWKSQPCWTLVFTGKYTQTWGFFTDKGFMRSREYFKEELSDCTGDETNAS